MDTWTFRDPQAAWRGLGRSSVRLVLWILLLYVAPSLFLTLCSNPEGLVGCLVPEAWSHSQPAPTNTQLPWTRALLPHGASGHIMAHLHEWEFLFCQIFLSNATFSSLLPAGALDTEELETNSDQTSVDPPKAGAPSTCLGLSLFLLPSAILVGLLL